MKKRLISFLFLFALASGVASGMPMHSVGNAKMTGCCDKAKNKDSRPETNAARLCCIFSCYASSPAPASGLQRDLSPVNVIANSCRIEIGKLSYVQHFQMPVAATHNMSFGTPTRPKYIQNKTFLI